MQIYRFRYQGCLLALGVSGPDQEGPSWDGVQGLVEAKPEHSLAPEVPN